jgi:hypothetical protein
MALWIDDFISVPLDLAVLDGNISEVATIENVDIAGKLRAAKQELSQQLESFLAQNKTGAQARDLNPVAVTEPLRRWLLYSTLVLFYRDAHHRQLSERYAGKLAAFQRLAQEAREDLFSDGVGCVYQQAPQPEAPGLSLVAGSMPAGFCYVAASMVSASGQESLASNVASIDVPSGSNVRVSRPQNGSPDHAWNIYAGQTFEQLALQNSTPLPAAASSYDLAQFAAGKAPGSGQAAEYRVSRDRRIWRG